VSKIFIQPFVINEFDDYLNYAGENSLNLEIATFASSAILDSNYKEILDKYQKKLADFQGIISVHGVFMDLPDGIGHVEERQQPGCVPCRTGRQLAPLDQDAVRAPALD